jgi:FkbM family methyltransferase
LAKQVHANVSPRDESLGIVFVDVGANIGSCTLEVASYKNVGRVYAFEPFHKNFRVLQSNIGMFPRQAPDLRIVAFPNAASDVSGEMVYFYARPHNVAATTDVGVSGDGRNSDDAAETVTLDETLMGVAAGTHLDALKVDVEGDELRVVRGAELLFDAGNFDFVKFEFTPTWLKKRHGASGPVELLDFFHHRGYEMYLDTDFDARGRWATRITDFDAFTHSIEAKYFHRTKQCDIIAIR